MSGDGGPDPAGLDRTSTAAGDLDLDADHLAADDLAAAGAETGPVPRPAPPSAWEPEGSSLARAFLARARTAPGPARTRTGRRGSSRPPREVGERAWSGPAPDERDPQLLERTVDRLVAEHGWGTELRVHGVLARWDLVVGPGIAPHCTPERYADTELTVRTTTTAWATQLRLLAPTLVRRLNEELGDGTVTRIEVLGPTQPSWVKGPRRVKGRGPRDTYG